MTTKKQSKDPLNCECVLKEGRCEPCLKKVRKVSHLFIKAHVEFQAKIEWAVEVGSPFCEVCSRIHVDEIGEEIVLTILSKVTQKIRDQLFATTITMFTSKGFVDLPRTWEAYRSLKKDGVIGSLGALLRELYGS